MVTEMGFRRLHALSEGFMHWAPIGSIGWLTTLEGLPALLPKEA